MQARYYWHPTRHVEVAEYFASVRDRTRANNILLHLSDALVRSSMLDLRKISALGMTEDSEFELQRIRITEKKYPALFRLYTSSPSALRGYIFGEILAAAARFRKERPDEAGMLIVNLTANLEDVGEDAYPALPVTSDNSFKPAENRMNESAEAKADSADSDREGEDTETVNGLGGTLLSSIGDSFDFME